MLYHFYCITNVVNGKKYVGLTKREPHLRFNEHIKYALTEHDIRHNMFMPLMNAIRKHGMSNFNFEVIDSCDCKSYNEAEILEGKYITEFKTLLTEQGYNLNRRETDGKRLYYDIEINEKIVRNNAGKNNPFFGRKHSAVTKEILSSKAKKRFSDPKQNPRYGYRYTEEDKQKHKKSMIHRRKPLMVDNTHFPSLADASQKLNISKQCISYRIKSPKFKGYYYL